jgi:hypothetical protein
VEEDSDVAAGPNRKLEYPFWDFYMGTVRMALAVGGMALLFSALIFFIPVRGRRPPSQESFEDSQKRIREYLREIRGE